MDFQIFSYQNQEQPHDVYEEPTDGSEEHILSDRMAVDECEPSCAVSSLSPTPSRKRKLSAVTEEADAREDGNEVSKVPS